MDSKTLDQFIERYEEVYFLSTKIASSTMSDSILADLTHEQYYVLRTLKQQGSTSPSELATLCYVNRSAITAMIDRLVAKGYVSRFRDEQDRRVVLLQTTEKGEAIFSSVEENVRKYVESILQSLPVEELESFIHTYEKIGEVIKEKYRSVTKA